MKVGEIDTPALLVDSNVLNKNISLMSAARPGESLRPHVKAFKSSYLAKELVAA
ncbi:MAG: metal-activated pyridoxal enzyme, partial [Acidimicrobiaceae bacterium]|nr:metal-activated pyridoxal enzyme [Acidimicrobiaceae bacterium]